MEIPKGWVQVTWSNPKRTCSQCGSPGNETGWRQDPERDRGLFYCPTCGPAGGKKTEKPMGEAQVKEMKREGGAGYTFRRGRPKGTSLNKKKA